MHRRVLVYGFLDPLVHYKCFFAIVRADRRYAFNDIFDLMLEEKIIDCFNMVFYRDLLFKALIQDCRLLQYVQSNLT